jgi:hypothetical protein
MRPFLLRALRLGLLQDLTQKRLRFILNITIHRNSKWQN